ncbi:MAG TPA: NAD-dependent epimerase/dehydratase family protein [Acidimicrobiales bacterium]
MAVTTVVLTGAAGRVGRRVLPLLVADPEVERVVAVDENTVPEIDAKVVPYRVDLRADDVRPVLDGADVLVHLAHADDELRRGRRRRRGRVDDDGTVAWLDAATDAGVQRIVTMSSALVYGAWPNNPVPLTEDAPVRPNAELLYAVQRAHLEYVVAEWAGADAARRAAVLRPCPALAPDGSSVLAQSLAAATGFRTLEEEPARQFLHLDDLATAVDTVRRAGFDGPCNVAPDGWIPGDVVRELSGVALRPALPARLARPLARGRWRFQHGPIPPELQPYTTYPVLVANDRLKAIGWRPRYTNEQTYVAGTEARWWTMLSPKRKQELALTGAGLLVAGAATATGLVVRRVIRRRF